MKPSSEFKIYKPRNNGGGCASSWDVSYPNKCVFVELAKQKTENSENGKATFDWKNPLRIKLGVSDIGEIISVLERRQGGVGPLAGDKHKGLFHQNEKGNVVLVFEKGQSTYYIKASAKLRDAKEAVSIAHSITNGEACVLLTLLRAAVLGIYNWDVKA